MVGTGLTLLPWGPWARGPHRLSGTWPAGTHRRAALGLPLRGLSHPSRRPRPLLARCCCGSSACPHPSHWPLQRTGGPSGSRPPCPAHERCALCPCVSSLLPSARHPHGPSLPAQAGEWGMGSDSLSLVFSGPRLAVLHGQGGCRPCGCSQERTPGVLTFRGLTCTDVPAPPGRSGPSRPVHWLMRAKWGSCCLPPTGRPIQRGPRALRCLPPASPNRLLPCPTDGLLAPGASCCSFPRTHCGLTQSL